MQTKKLEAYSMLAAAFFGIKNEAPAQVLYTDLEPDVVIDTAGEFYLLDVDDNITNEFGFIYAQYMGWPGGDTDVRLLFGIGYDHFDQINEIVGFHTVIDFLGVDYAYAFSYSQIISANLSGITPKKEMEFNKEDLMVMIAKRYTSGGSDTAAGLFYWGDGVYDHYIGFRFEEADEPDMYHYGWIRCDVYDDERTLVIKDFAYEQQPDIPIRAGKKTSYVSVSELDGGITIKIFPNPVLDILNIQTSEIITQIQVLNNEGKELITEHGEDIKTIPVKSLAAGFYTLDIQTQQGNTKQIHFIKTGI